MAFKRLASTALTRLGRSLGMSDLATQLKQTESAVQTLSQQLSELAMQRAQVSPPAPTPGVPPPLTIQLDYPFTPRPRFGGSQPRHPKLHAILERGREDYARLLQRFHAFTDDFSRIPVHERAAPTEPAWVNGWIPGLDAAALYALLCLHNPERYFEVGSGNSTMFAARAIRDHGLRTRITSVDPAPRAEINALCDRVVRQPFENVDLALFDDLGDGDILFIDNSHRAFQNSDVTVFFVELLPRLRPGVLVQIHDIVLPDDYPEAWRDRYYNEQYLLACYLLAEGRRFEVVLPNHFVSIDPELRAIMTPVWEQARLAGVETHGGSFWLRMK